MGKNLVAKCWIFTAAFLLVELPAPAEVWLPSVIVCVFVTSIDSDIGLRVPQKLLRKNSCGVWIVVL
jgi:hypothetical protein